MSDTAATALAAILADHPDTQTDDLLDALGDWGDLPLSLFDGVPSEVPYLYARTNQRCVYGADNGCTYCARWDH